DLGPELGGGLGELAVVVREIAAALVEELHHRVGAGPDAQRRRQERTAAALERLKLARGGELVAAHRVRLLGGNDARRDRIGEWNELPRKRLALGGVGAVALDV